MLTHRSRNVLRPVAVLAGVPVALALTALPAAADTPQTWGRTDVTGLQILLVLLVIPAAIALVISLLAVIPTWKKGESYVPGQAWRSESQWFGGPRKGVEAADEVDPRTLQAGERGGTSGHW